MYRNGAAASAGGGRHAAAWLGVLVLACGRADDEPGSALSAGVGVKGEGEPTASAPHDSSAGDGAGHDAGLSPTSAAHLECPAARPDVITPSRLGYARDPAGGDCYAYTDRYGAPEGWLCFDSDMECRCSIESCPSTIEEAEQRLCAVTSPPANVHRLTGCELVAVVDYSGYEWVFAQPSASGGSATAALRLVGAAKYSQASSFDAGPTLAWSEGVSIAQCDYGPSFECQLCGDDPATDLPPCQ